MDAQRLMLSFNILAGVQQGAQEKTLDNARQGEALYKLGIPE
jgi:hypothetical protein